MTLNLSFDILFEDLYTPLGLRNVDAAFCSYLKTQDATAYDQLIQARQVSPLGKEHSEVLLTLAPHTENFIISLFGLEKTAQEEWEKFEALSPLYPCKRTFIQRRVASGYKPGESIDSVSAYWEELDFATSVMGWLKEETTYGSELNQATTYARWALFTPEGQAAHARGVLFKLPKKLDPLVLIDKEHVHPRLRDGFKMTDPGPDVRYALDHAHYCIWCHEREKDSCSKGLKEKSTDEFAANALDVTLTGCPLEEKISEMNWAKAHGFTLGALAIATVDNPMIAATGHRICNDCMKACIYQKQTPVDIPHVETQILQQVLDLPWGFEIYSLLTRWNPLNFVRPYPGVSTDRDVLVVGMGPAGFTLAHHLLQEGHRVVGIEGAKIEPLTVPFEPMEQTHELFESLDERVMAGFGGVAEYGITVRWNKNYLKLIRLLLERNPSFQLYGGVRMGGTLTLDQAFELGFDHVALCAGAGKPRRVDMKNGLAKGVRQASDFLMALQLTGAAKKESITNLQLRLPVVVIGGGLTAIDTATEAMAYYPVQVEKFLSRYERLVAERGADAVRALWSLEDQEVADTFISHAKAYRHEREEAQCEGRLPNIPALTQRFGGVTVAYRKYMLNAPAYRLNHEEVEKALEEGIWFEENLIPEVVHLDGWGNATALQCQGKILPAKSILVAAGTEPNTVLATEEAGLHLDGHYFEAIDDHGQKITPERSAKPKEVAIFMHERGDGRRVSFLGDLHPSFAGNVVKAMASAKRGYPFISKHLARLPKQQAVRDLGNDLRAEVHKVNRLTPTIVEVIIKAPAAAKAFEPGQFYRLQNFETHAPLIEGTRLAMEGMAMTGAWVDKDKGLLATIVLEMGGSSSLCATLEPGEPVVLMGPTGTPTEIPSNENVLLVGGGLGNAVLFSIGAAMRQKGCHVTYLAAYRKNQDRFHVDRLREAADKLVWCIDEVPNFQDTHVVHGNVLKGLRAQGDLRHIDRLIVIGSDRMMAAVSGYVRDHPTFFKPTMKTIASINSPMQCMMKEICAQCLQKHVDPKTGVETVVFSCTNQDQNLMTVDYENLHDRLSQNSVSEKLTALWIDRCLGVLDGNQLPALDAGSETRRNSTAFRSRLKEGRDVSL